MASRERPRSAGSAWERSGAAIAGAVALHAAILLGSRALPGPELGSTRAADDSLIELFDPTPTSAPTAEPVAGRPSEMSGSAPRSALPSLPDLPRVEPPAAIAGPAPSAVASAEPVATARPEYDGPPAALPIGEGLSLGLPSAYGLGPQEGVGLGAKGATTAAPEKGPIAPVISPDSEKASRIAGAPIVARDHGLGLGTQGASTVAGAIADAVRGSTLPGDAGATFVAQLSGDGALISLRVLQWDKGSAAVWNNVAAVAVGTVGSRKLPISGMGKKGAIVRVAVRSAVTYPSGSDSPAKARLPSLTEGPPRDVAPAPSPDGDACAPERWSDLKPLCGVGAKVGVFDVADMVSKKHRSVKTSFHITLLDDPPSAGGSVTAPRGPL